MGEKKETKRVSRNHCVEIQISGAVPKNIQLRKKRLRRSLLMESHLSRALKTRLAKKIVDSCQDRRRNKNKQETR